MKFMAAASCVLASQVEAAIPVFVMLPLDVISNDGFVKDSGSLENYFKQLAGANVEGVMADCWWGIAEKEERAYDFAPYVELTQMASNAGLKIQYVMSFHQVCEVSINLSASGFISFILHNISIHVLFITVWRKCRGRL